MSLSANKQTLLTGGGDGRELILSASIKSAYHSLARRCSQASTLTVNCASLSTLTVNCASLSISLGEERGGGGGHTHTRIMKWIVKSLNKSGTQEKVDFSNH